MKNRHSTVSQASVVCVALNPALDQTIEVAELHLGEVNRAQRAQTDVGGKGINVASCLADFDVGVAVTGILGEDNPALFESLFADKQIENYCLYFPGKTRINTKLVDPASGQTTDINLPGVQLAEADIPHQLDRLKLVLTELAKSASWVVLSGSLPPRWPADCYAELIRHIQSLGKKILLDASGAALKHALAAKPEIIKPNRDELAEYLGTSLNSQTEIIAAARNLFTHNEKLELVAVSMGEDGALFVSRTEALLAHPLKVELISSVGAGDAMVAGIIASQLESLSLADSARLSTAFSAGKLTRLGPHLPGIDAVRPLALQVRVTPLE